VKQAYCEATDQNISQWL